MENENVAGNETPGSVVLARSLKIAGELLVAPGSSLILDGKIASGGAHVLGGLFAGMIVGPLGWGLVAANSYAQSITGKSLVTLLRGEAKSRPHSVVSPA
jgi:hypothetical protein